MICTQVTQISHSTVGSSFSVSFSADSTPNDLEMLRMMREWFMRWNNSGVSFTRADTPQTDWQKMTEEEIDTMLARVLVSEQTDCTGSPIGDYRDGVGAWQKERSE